MFLFFGEIGFFGGRGLGEGERNRGEEKKKEKKLNFFSLGVFCHVGRSV